jgi:2-polyprenyl-6-methoxyphenol hydroxylase-like FAD-dependent oxidoreductase
LLFFDRQALLQILYDHLQDKSKILKGRKFESAELDDWGVTATCADGSTFRGTLLVGADGIHSKARTVMRALGGKLNPGAFDENEESKVPCYYRCSFGIAVDVPGWVTGEQHIVTGDGRSQLVISGPDNRVYWFMFERLPEVRYGDEIPRYTTKDEEEFANRNADVAITESITFGQVFACRLSSALTPLHEVVYKKWFFRRMITLGDSAHKVNTISHPFLIPF